MCSGKTVKSQTNISKYNTFRVVLPYSGRLFCLTVCSHARDHLYTSATAAAGYEEPGETLTVRAGISGWKHQRRNHGHSLSKIHGVRSKFIIKFKYCWNYIICYIQICEYCKSDCTFPLRKLWLIGSWCKINVKYGERLQRMAMDECIVIEWMYVCYKKSK